MISRQTRVSGLIHQAFYVLKTKGFLELTKKSIAHLKRAVFEHENYFLYEQALDDWDETLFKPKLSNVRSEIIHYQQGANYNLPDYLGPYRIAANARLEKGAIGICIYVGDEFAHISWVALTKEAKMSFDPLPYSVKYSEKQACTGGTITDTKFRGQNLMTYANYIKFQYLKKSGIVSVRHVIEKSNIASQKGYDKFGPILYAEAKYLRLFSFKYWREKPVP